MSDLYYYDKEIYNYIEDKDKFSKIISQLKNKKELDELILSEESFLINVEDMCVIVQLYF